MNLQMVTHAHLSLSVQLFFNIFLKQNCPIQLSITRLEAIEKLRQDSTERASSLQLLHPLQIISYSDFFIHRICHVSR
jgi:hypothetical protein